MRRKLKLKRLADVVSAGTAVAVVADVERFRWCARDYVRPTDQVLEIGCSSGMLTRVLAETGARIVAIDVATEFVASTAAAMAAHPQVTVAVADGRNMPEVTALITDPDVIFLDIGGDSPMDSVAFLIRECLQAFTPRQIVVRNAELATFCSMVTACEPPEHQVLRKVEDADRSARALDSLLALSYTANAESRAYAARRLRLVDAPEARQRLAELAADPNPRVSRTATHPAGNPVPPGAESGHDKTSADS